MAAKGHSVGLCRVNGSLWLHLSYALGVISSLIIRVFGLTNAAVCLILDSVYSPIVQYQLEVQGAETPTDPYIIGPYNSHHLLSDSLVILSGHYNLPREAKGTHRPSFVLVIASGLSARTLTVSQW